MSKGKKTNHNNKKAAVLQQNTSKSKLVPIIGVIVAVVAIGAAAFYMTGPTSSGSPSVATATAGVSQVSYPVSMFDDGKVHHFDYKADGMTVRYFVLKSSDGVVRAAFDACDVCWPAGKGYYQDGDNMVCRNCGRRFASIKVNEVKGGCNPAPLNRNVVDGNLIIKAEDIMQGKTYFDFKGKV